MAGRQAGIQGPGERSPARRSSSGTCVSSASTGAATPAWSTCKDGKVIRIRPARFYDQYTKEEVKPWVMHARGKTFDPGDKTLPPPLSLCYKKRVFSPARIRYPMKRVDFDPSGAPGSTGPGGRNIQNRGTSKYVRISWDEALDIVTAEMNRMKDDLRPHRHPLPERPARREQDGARPARLRPQAARPVRRLHPPGPQRRLLGGLVLGRQARVGLRVHRPAAAADATCSTTSPRTPSCSSSGAATPRPRPGAGAASWSAASTTGGPSSASSRSTSPPTATTATPCTPTSGSRCCPTPTPPSTWPSPTAGSTKGTYDKEYLETHAYGVDKFEDYVMGEEDGVPKSPEWAAPITGVPGPHHQGPRRRMGLQAHHRRHLQRRPGHPRPLLHRAGPPAGALPGHARAWASRAATRPR